MCGRLSRPLLDDGKGAPGSASSAGDGRNDWPVKHGDISTTAMDISFSILFEFYFIFSLYFEALLYYLYRSFHAYVIRASKRQRHC